MSTDNISVKNTYTKKRPFGVWVLTIYVLILAGINLPGDSFLVLKGEVAMFRSDQVPYMLFWAYLNISIIIASILTWAGWEPGRILFLFLISVFYFMQVQGLYLRITHQYFENNPIIYQIDSWFRFIGNILIPILYIWYFNRLSTKVFYSKSEQSVK